METPRRVAGVQGVNRCKQRILGGASIRFVCANERMDGGAVGADESAFPMKARGVTSAAKIKTNTPAYTKSYP